MGEKILGSVAIKADSERLDLLLKELKGKNLETLIAEGIGKLASVPSGGAAAAGGGEQVEQLQLRRRRRKRQRRRSLKMSLVTIWVLVSLINKSILQSQKK